MAPPTNTAASKPRRHKKRKSRTQVSSDSSSASSSSSDSESDSSPRITSPKASKRSKRETKSKTSSSRSNADLPSPEQEQEQQANSASVEKDATPAAFTQFMLQTSTLEFADDLDLVRAADDFKGAESIDMLVHALKQGSGCFSVDEIARVVDAGAKK